MAWNDSFEGHRARQWYLKLSLGDSFPSSVHIYATVEGAVNRWDLERSGGRQSGRVAAEASPRQRGNTPGAQREDVFSFFRRPDSQVSRL